jgi:hypothetical protein
MPGDHDLTAEERRTRQDELLHLPLEMIRAERWLPRRAYDKGRAGQFLYVGQDDGRPAALDQLLEWYPRYGLTTDAQAALELIKSFKMRAADLAGQTRAALVAKEPTKVKPDEMW